MTVDIRIVRAGQMYRYYLRETVVGDGRRPARTPLREAQEQAGVPVGRWMGRGLAVLGLAPGQEVTEAELRNLFGERGRHPHADRIEADLLARGASAKKAFKAGALGRRVTVTGVDFVFRPQPTIYLLCALGDEETRRVIETAHERAIERVLEWIEDEVAVIRYGKHGIYRVRPPGGLVAARFRHYEARSGMPLLHDHLILSVKGQRLDGKWGSIHTLALQENTVAASALYNELVAAEVCEALGLATEPRTVTPGRRPVMEIAGVPHELIRWTARRSDQIAACLEDLEHEYVTAVDDDGELKFLPVVSERARAKLNQMAARKTRPPKQKTRPLAQLRAWWKTSAILTSGVAVDILNSLLEYARAAAAAIRARVAAAVDVALAAVDVAATVFVMKRRRPLPPPAPARRSPPPPRSRPARPPPRPRTGRPNRGRRHLHPLPGHQRTENCARPGGRLPPLHRPVGPVRPPRPAPPTHPRTPARTRNPRPIPASRLRPGPRARTRGSGKYPASRRSTSELSSPVRRCGRSCAPPPPPPACGAGRTTSSRTSRQRCPSSCPRPPTPSTTTRSRTPDAGRRST
ncbi:MobF family relaxase [Streptomyces sp. NPDC088921]|uniref:MobF family relaxase n=1 Tax=unclassified Streptomyces TaxID=2593676 RepID=UPI00341E2505